jgi:poly(A) polymerase
MNDLQSKIRRIATCIVLSTRAEKEFEKLMKVMLKGTPWAGRAYAVGGYIRDEYLGLDAKDLDVVVEMRGGSKKLTDYLYKTLNKENKGVVSRPRQMGQAYPIWQITFKDDVGYKGKEYKTRGAVIEFADTMKERFPSEESRQREVEFGTLEDDIMRRDFTVNMLLKDLTTGEIKDLAGVSKKDLEEGVLRGHPKVSLDKIFSDDPLRMIRLIRFQAKYNWNIPLSVIKDVKRNARRIKIVSNERIMEELTKVMKMGKLAQAIKFMKMVGLLKHILPEIEALGGVEQSVEHHAEGDVYKHTLMVVKKAPPTIEGQLAALLHDVGKAQTQKMIGDKIQFLGHEEAGAEMAKAILYRLKFDTKTINKVVTMVRSHMRPHHLVGATEKALRRFIRDVGDEMVDGILDLAKADELGKIPPGNAVPELKERIEKIRKSPIKVTKKSVLNGDDIMNLLHIEPSPLVGEVMKYLIDIEDDLASKGLKLTKNEAKALVLKEFARR